MLATAIIVFREVLEAALVVSIVMAGTKGVTLRGRWVLAGVVAGVIGACLVAAFAEAIAAAAAGIGQELFNAGVLFAAVLMLGWHCVWMGKHGREIARDMSALSRAVAAGARPLYALAIVCGIAVLREGSEVVLFVYGIAASGGTTATGLLIGGALGVLAGVALGFLIYFGLLRIPARYLFSVTTWLIVFLAAGMAAQGAGFLLQAGLLPPLGRSLWDTTWLLSTRSILGQVLHTLIGYDARPSGIQLIFYLATLIVIGGLTWLFGRPSIPPAKAAAAE
jgi:high-affinity iron transporter